MSCRNDISQCFVREFSKNSIAQGTIEYLIVIAIVIVIGLLVTSLATGFFDSQQITKI